ncbi:ANTAR domain-containing protein [Nocardioides plantarum]|uniref:ANTAR domain-containing protein n=1 Tax=Nocardioides plantarum TaxID=29299 RepID=A0ABV5KB64_9ACTN|nr:ANTAR domain-containing protein [Nocardioides plantarum]
MTGEPPRTAAGELADLTALLPGITTVDDAAEAVLTCARRCLDAEVAAVARHGSGGPVVLAQTSPGVTDLYALAPPGTFWEATGGREPGRAPVLTGTSTSTRTSTGLSRHLGARGVEAVASTVLTTTRGRPVTLDVFAATVERLVPHPPHVRLFLDFAGLVMTTLDRAEHLDAALESREVIAQAQGILRERFALTPAEGMSVLRRYSQQSHTKVRDVAREIVTQQSSPAPTTVPRHPDDTSCSV